MRQLILSTAMVAAAPALAFGQTDLKTQIEHWRTQRDAWRAQAQTALAVETAREKEKECPDANTTRAIEECLSVETAKTQSNYEAFTGPIRSMLASPYPSKPGAPPYSGPTGIPPSSGELVAGFNKLEAQSTQFRKDAAQAAFNQYKGVLWRLFAAEAGLRPLRLHMREVAFIYGEELSNLAGF